jgi:hypothetical protein
MPLRRSAVGIDAPTDRAAKPNFTCEDAAMTADLRRTLRPLRHRVRQVERQARLRRELPAAARVVPGEPFPRDQLDSLRRAWANPGYEADLDYLGLVWQHASEAREPVLECGSGITTLLLALAAGRRGVPVWTLEHDFTWYRRMQGILQRHSLPGVTFCYSPLIDHGEFAWYDAPIDSMPPSFGLVVCDGPPGSTRGGRAGLLPVMGERLGGTTVLLDDAERQQERETIVSWQRDWSTETTITRSAGGGEVATIRMQLPSDRP